MSMKDTRRPCERVEHGCQINELFQLLSKAHMLDVLHILNSSEGPVRFNALQKQLRMSPNTLSLRLKELQDAGLVERYSHDTIPPRVDYEATPKAHDLRSVFQELAAWASRNDLQPMPRTPTLVTA